MKTSLQAPTSRLCVLTLATCLTLGLTAAKTYAADAEPMPEKTKPVAAEKTAEKSAEKTPEKTSEKAPKKSTEAAAKSAEKGKGKNMSPVVVIETSLGKIEIELNHEKAPNSVDNFLKYVDEKFYDGTIFHRVIPTFMIQGGGFTESMSQKPVHGPIKNEAANGLKNVKYSLAMARTGDPHSATAQFFINTVDNDFLNYTSADQRGYGYAVFGKVISGTDVVDKIKAVATTSKGPYENVPTTPVVMKSVHRK